MAKLYKVEMYILDVNEDYENIDDITNGLENSSDVNLIPFNTQEVKFEWDDELPINKVYCDEEEFRKYFEEGND